MGSWCTGHFLFCLSGKNRYNCNMSKDTFQLVVFVALCWAWLMTNIVLKVGPGADMTFFVFLLVLSFYRTKNSTGIAGTLAHIGLRPLSRRAVMLALGLAALIITGTCLLAWGLKVDLADLMAKQKSVGQSGFHMAKAYSPLIASVALVIQSFWGTFFEEFFFRGLLLRIIKPYHYLTAQLVQALLFGFLHVAGSFGAGLPGNALWFLFLYPTLAALILGFFYLREGHHLTMIWTAHFMVNTVAWITYVNSGLIR